MTAGAPFSTPPERSRSSVQSLLDTFRCVRMVRTIVTPQPAITLLSGHRAAGAAPAPPSPSSMLPERARVKASCPETLSRAVAHFGGSLAVRRYVLPGG